MDIWPKVRAKFLFGAIRCMCFYAMNWLIRHPRNHRVQPTPCRMVRRWQRLVRPSAARHSIIMWFRWQRVHSRWMAVPTDSKGSGSTGTLVLKTTKDSWTYQGTVSASSDNKVAVEVDLWSLLPMITVLPDIPSMEEELSPPTKASSYRTVRNM